MGPQQDVLAAKCLDLVMKAMISTGGDHAIIRSGQVPVLTRASRRFRMASTPIPRTAVSEIAQCLLPKDEMRALSEIGETRYHVPHKAALGHDDFIVDVTDTEGELCVDIAHHHIAHADDVPEEFFDQAQP
jgi:hypothetical protein